MPERGAKETRPCETCGEPVTRLLSQTLRRPHWFCDAACRAASGPVPRSSRGGRVSVVCAGCGAPLERFRSQMLLASRQYCSRSCRASHQGRERVAAGTWKRPDKPRRGTALPCGSCGKPVYRAPGYPPNQTRYCSRSCHDAGQRVAAVVKPCAQCGAPMTLAPSTARTRRFCDRACEQAHRLKRSDGRVINGRPVLINHTGYVTVYAPDHPRAGKTGRMLEHRLVMERILGRLLRPDEHVDHINRIKTDNRPENLQLLSPRDHNIKTQRDRAAELAFLRREVARYRERVGDLPPEEGV